MEHRLPRTKLAEAVARRLWQSLGPREAKMYGVLLVEDGRGTLGVLKAFSGSTAEHSHLEGWVPPVFEYAPTPLEEQTKRRLKELKAVIEILSENPLINELVSAQKSWRLREEALKGALRARKLARHWRREEGIEESVLVKESQADSRRKRQFKQEKAQALAPLLALNHEIRSYILEAKRERRTLSRTLQAEMHSAFGQEMWSGQPWSIASLFPNGPPTGVGECCAPKLLHYANQHSLRPVALAEFWWGDSTPTRSRGSFYPACRQRCQPMLGPLLSNLNQALSIHFEDEELVVVEKPSGVLTVPGREGWNQDSLLLRLEERFGVLKAVHRLDMETSGLVIFARNSRALTSLQEQFAQRRVGKVYQALLEGSPSQPSGEIALPLASDPNKPGTYRVSVEGKSALTRYKILDAKEARVEFRPVSGRSHQLRLHAADGLGFAIIGDRIYGREESFRRLALHAESLEFAHPTTGRTIRLNSAVPF